MRSVVLWFTAIAAVSSSSSWLACCVAQDPFESDAALAFRMDGEFNDWGRVFQSIQDPSRDATAKFDVTELSATSRGTMLILRLKLAEAIQLQNGIEEDGKLILELECPKTTLRLDFRGRANSVDNGAWGKFAWEELSFVCLPTILSDQYELQIDLSAVGMRVGEVVRVNCSGSDSFAEALSVVLGGSVENAVGESTLAKQGTIRIANLNTLRGGLADEVRGPKIARLIAAAEASVYCFQEEREEDLFLKGVEQCFTSNPKSMDANPKSMDANPKSMDANPNVVWHEGCAIVSNLPLRKIDFETEAAAAGVVTLPGDGAKVLVISTHLRCCGFAGSDRDDTRVEQAQQIATEIRRLREGAFGEALKSVPIVMVGDYNHVGSSRPLEVLAEVGLNDVLARCSRDGSAYTWRAITPEETFWPGRLDLVTHSKRMTPRQCSIFDSERMTAEQLKKLGLKKEDSRCSDHLMLIADFDVE